MKAILKATVFTTAGALLALPAMAQGGNSGGSFNGPDQGFHAGQYMSPSDNSHRAGQYGQMAYAGDNGWQGNSGPGNNYSNQGQRNFGNNGSYDHPNDWRAQNGPNTYNGMESGNSGNRQSARDNWRDGAANWQNHAQGNWQTGQNAYPGGQSQYQDGFRSGFEAGFTQGYRTGFGRAHDNRFASRDTSGPMRNGMTPGSPNPLANAAGNGSSGSAATGQNASNARSSGSNAGTQTLSETQIRNQLKQSGYTNVHNLQQSGDTFTADAQMNGHTERLTVDAKTGDVIRSANSSG